MPNSSPKSESNHHMSIDNSATSKVTPAQIIPREKPANADPYTTPQKKPQVARIYIFTVSAVLSAIAIGASLFALVIPSCNEGSLNVKLWAFEYQLIKKGSCSTPPK